MLCNVCGRENAADSRFCNECGSEFLQGEGSEHRKLVTVLFCDLADSTALGKRLDPETLKRVLLDYYDVARTAVERHGGVVQKFIGDAVMSVFGVPSVREDDAYRALRAAWDLRAAVEHLSQQMEPQFGIRLVVRIGVNTGEVVTAHAGALALGDAINSAARLEQLAEPGEVLLGDTTAKLVSSWAELQPLDRPLVDGRSGQVAAHRLIKVRDSPGLESSGPLVGREPELATVLATYERVASGREAHLLTVLGPAGIGKTRLVAELASSIGTKATVLVGRCLSYGTGLAYWPIAEMLDHASGDDLRERLRSILEGIGEAEEIASRVAAAVGAAEMAGTSDETIWAVRRLMEALARERPLVCVFEDFQWAQPALVELIQAVVERSRNSAMLCVCIARPELFDVHQSWTEWRNGTVLRLEPLPYAAARQLVDRFADPRLSDAVRIRALGAAEGNPLFLQQLIAEAAESDGENKPLPVVLTALLEARLDHLPGDERKLLQTAAIEGNVFHTRPLATLLAVEENEVHGSLLSLIRRELVRPARASIPGIDAYRFEHGLVREAAYLALPKVERAALHERFAAWIDRGPELRTPEADALVGHHLDMSFRCRTELGLHDDETDRVAADAAERLTAAGRRALRLGDVHAAHAQLQRASDLLPAPSPSGISLLPDLAVAEFQVRGIRKALETADRCMELAVGPELDSPRMHATVLSSFWRMLADPEDVDLDVLLETIEDAVHTFERRDEPLGILRARNLLWEIWQWRGETEQQTSAAVAALEAAERVASAEDIDWAICNLGFALVDGPDPLGFATQKLQEWHDRMHDRAGRIMLGAFLDYTLALAGDTATAMRGVDRADLVGTAYVTEVPRLMWGRIALAALDYGAAERQFRAGWDVARAQGDNWFGPLAASELARALLEQGRFQEARQILEWLAHTRPAGDPEIFIKKLAVLARLSVHEGDGAAADRISSEAIGLTDGTEFLMFRAEALLDRAAVLRMLDRGDEAGSVVDDSLELYARKGCVPSPSRLLAATGSSVV